MADRNNADSRRHLAVETPPPQLSKDMQGPDKHFPLSPQWLLPKPGENKLGTASRDLSPYGAGSAASKAASNGEDLSTGKRRGVFRPSMHDGESGRRDHWRDEEREPNSAIRRDRWREVDKELGDMRRTERWSDNSSKHSGEARRAPPERWSDSGNKEGNYDHRESKWNTRWGPDDKEAGNWSDKLAESGRERDGFRDKGLPHFTSHEKDINNHEKDTEKEETYSRSWRSNFSLSRGRGDPSHHPSQSPNRPSAMFSYGRGRSENDNSVFSNPRGKFNSSNGSANSGSSRPYHLVSVSDKSDGASGDAYTLRYSRMKLLDLYRLTDIKNLRISLDGFTEVPSLTQAEALEPLAFSAPGLEESGILKGIDKGDIISSGVPQVSKDGSAGRNTLDAIPSKQVKLGNREDRPTATDDYTDDKTDKFRGILEKADEANNGEVSRMENSVSRYVGPRRSQSVSDGTHGPSHDRNDFSIESEHKNRASIASSFYKDEAYWQKNDGLASHPGLKNDPVIRRELSENLDRESKANIILGQDDTYSSGQTHPSPEELSLYYKDPQGQIQGPFSGSDLIGWFEAGYFGIDLQVRLANAPAEAHFSLLGDVMPHLRAKARPPPGFGAAKESDVSDSSLAGKFGTPSSIHAGLGDINILKNVPRSRHDTATEAQTRFLESLMSANMSSSPLANISSSGGMQEYDGSSSGNISSVGSESVNDVNYLLAQKRLLERQQSLPNPLPYWSGRDVPMAPKIDLVSDSSALKSKLLPQMGDSSHQVLQSPDLLSILHSSADKSQLLAAKSGVPMWSNIPEAGNLNSIIHSGMGVSQDVMNMHHNLHISPQVGVDVQQQRLLPHNRPPLSHLDPQFVDLSSGMFHPEELFPEISQDPQLLSLLQQQYALSQLQLHAQAPISPQLSLMDKILLLKQQQQQQEQQQLLLQQQQQQEQQQLLLLQQQHLLSQVLSARSSNQNFVDPSYAQIHAVVPPGNLSPDILGLQRLHEARQTNQQMPVCNLHDGQLPNHLNVNLQGTQNISCPVSSGAPALDMPHQIFDHASSKVWDASLSQEVEIIKNADSTATIARTENLPLAKSGESHEQEYIIPENTKKGLDKGEIEHKDYKMSHASETILPFGSEGVDILESLEDSPRPDLLSCASDQIENLKISSENIPDHCLVDSFSVKQLKKVETQEIKKASEKKSKKQKTSKVKSASDVAKVASKTISCHPSKLDFEVEDSDAGGAKSSVQNDTEGSLLGAPLGGDENSLTSSANHLERSELLSSKNPLSKESDIVEKEKEQGKIGSLFNAQATSTHRAWKSASDLRPKSLLEIQAEEQLRAQREAMSCEIAKTVAPASIASTVPWSDLVANSERKFSVDVTQGATMASSGTETSGSTLSSKSKKSPLHDLLAEEVLAKLNEVDKDLAGNDKDAPFPPLSGTQTESLGLGDDDFIEAKDSKKNRKKASKSKNAGAKAPSPVGSLDLCSPLPPEKNKSTHQVQQENETLPAPPNGPSLGDFVPWKGDHLNPVPSPVWSTDSAKLQKPMSLREIQREQGKKSSVQQQIPIPSPMKLQPNRGNRGTGSWQVSGSSPSKGASPIQTNSHISAQSKSRSEDDLFWGPLQPSKQEPKQSDGTSMLNQSGWGTKGTPVKGTLPGASSRQKSLGSKLPPSPPSAVMSIVKSRKDATSKQSEAMDFREWCESEWTKLTGTTDTSFLEFCIKQQTQEAEMLLRENLGSLDRNHTFIDKFLNYKEFLSSDIIEMAFKAHKPRPSNGDVTGLGSLGTGANRDIDAEMEAGQDGAAKAGGVKKKVKKGKKVSPSVLGFNVVSNRIMMGEIQGIED
ncbi:protein ESSENTIAL FOR POTEXVIRUS ACCUMULATION 1-like isoform X1 [Typha angustifolia]|uniref:protein ESSENTIAL FOR POTEXVIRUS ACCUMULATION 1-like isoform X1 n=2 Tax=Typha angustifolia TaxID=59011 RepID=UPI003C2F09B8